MAGLETARYYRGVFRATLVLLALSLTVGIAHSLMTSNQLPALRLLDYMPHIAQLERVEGYEPARKQLKLASEIDFAMSTAPRMLANLARHRGDLETELYALRIVKRRNPLDVGVRNETSRALLETGDVGPVLAKKIIRNSLVALQADPSSAAAHAYLGEAYWIQGDKERAAHLLRESLRLDPRLDAARQRLDRDLRGY